MNMLRKISPLLTVAILLSAALTLAACADAGNYAGAIAYQRVIQTDSQIFVMDPEGEVKTRISASGGWNFMPSWSPNGESVAYFTFNPTTQMTTVNAVDVTQAEFEQVLLTNTGTYNIQFGALKWSPDGQSILYYSIDALDISDIYKIDVLTGSVAYILPDPVFFDYAPDWSPDGSKFVFASNRPDKDDPILDLYLADVNGENLVRLTDNRHNGWVDTLPAWSPDGETIAFWRYNYIPGETFAGGPNGIWLMDLTTREETLLYEAPFPSGENPPVWSPNGIYLAFLEDLDNQHTLYVVEVATGEFLDIDLVAGDKRALSWSPDSRALVFSNYTEPNVAMYILDIKAGELTEVVEADLGASIGDPDWGGE
jgi:Tol biopolymer transport system component